MVIDVTSSVSPGLASNSIITDVIIPTFKDRGVTRILDFGAGALRHTVPFLNEGFEVCAVEFESGFARPGCKAGLDEANKYPGFSTVLWPHDFLSDKRKFDGVLLTYVLQTMPLPGERIAVLKAIRKKTERDAYLVYMSRYNQLPKGISSSQRVSDGHFMWPRREEHSFYREFTTPETHEMISAHSFRYIKSLRLRASSSKAARDSTTTSEPSQRTRSILDGDAWRNHQETACEPFASWMTNCINRLPCKQHRHHCRLAGASRQLQCET